MATISSFKPQGINKSTQALADVTPNGRVFDNKNDSSKNTRKLLRGLSQEQVRYESAIFDLVNRYIPNLTDSYIEEWEQQLGIPDECFSNDILFTDAERRRNIIIKLAFLTLLTEEDYLALATILGLTVSFTGGGDNIFPLTFPIVFSNKFVLTIFIEGIEDDGFPYTFPFTFGTANVGLFECLVLKYKQAYIDVQFIFSEKLTKTPLLDGNGEIILDGNGDVIFVPIL